MSRRSAEFTAAGRNSDAVSANALAIARAVIGDPDTQFTLYIVGRLTPGETSLLFDDATVLRNTVTYWQADFRAEWEIEDPSPEVAN